MGGKTSEGTRRYDFRRPNRFARDSVRSLEVAHEVFTRRYARALSSALRAVVQIEPLAVDQMSFDDYVRSMPNPVVVATVSLAPLPGVVTLELGVQLALVLVDRLLGGALGAAATAEIRRPTDLESYLVGDLMAYGAAALAEAICPLVQVTPEVVGIEYNPQFVQAAAPSDTLLLLSYRVSFAQQAASEGMLTVGYPAPALSPLIERLDSLQSSAEQHALPGGERDGLHDQLADVAVDVSARLRACPVAARDLATLAVGDVLRLDHRVDEPVLLGVDGVHLGEAHLGRRGRRLAVQIAKMTATAGAADDARD